MMHLREYTDYHELHAAKTLLAQALNGGRKPTQAHTRTTMSMYTAIEVAEKETRTRTAQCYRVQTMALMSLGNGCR